MDREEFYEPSYKGSKDFNQWDVRTANATGFGAAADDYMERGIDLNEQLIRNKPATFFFRMNSEAMTGAGIQNGDILIVDKSIRATNGKIIVAAVNGDLLVRRYQQTMNRVSLQADNSKYSNIDMGEFTEYKAWGVVTCVIHILDAALLAATNPVQRTKQKKIMY
jgi:DNA polymerase V